MAWPMCCGPAANPGFNLSAGRFGGTQSLQNHLLVTAGRLGGTQALQNHLLLYLVASAERSQQDTKYYFLGAALPPPTPHQRCNSMDATRQDLVTAHVRRAIMTGHLHPGDRLIEQTLAAELRMSRGPVRDALRLLEQEGLVQIY